MALRAGYHGVKKSVLAAIANLSGAKIIKSIGDGLKLTNAGKLSCDINTDTMEFKNGKLSSKGRMSKVNVFDTPTTTTGDITLKSSIDDATFIEIVVDPGEIYKSSYIIGADTLRSTDATNVLGVWDYQLNNFSRTLRLYYKNSTTLCITELTNSLRVVEINIF